MNSFNAALLINFLGFTVGVALYLLLAVMVLRHYGGGSFRRVNVLLLTTAFLGLIWNLGELLIYVERDFGGPEAYRLITAAAYSALGFLPSVVVHAAQNEVAGRHRLSIAAYILSIFAAALHFYAAITGGITPSPLALTTLTFGSVTLAGALFFFNFRQTIEKKAIWTSALLILAVSAFHFVGEGEGSSWPVELVAHQSSLPLALVILYQNYRFAFADLFLKRAISLLLLSIVAFTLYLTVAAPLLRYHETHDRNDVQAISLILTLWIATALVYPMLHRLAVLLVDRIILQRADYVKLTAELAAEIESAESSGAVLGIISSRLGDVLTANRADWEECIVCDDHSAGDETSFSPDSASIIISTAEPPFFRVILGDFQGGRRLLSDETAMLDTMANAAARRIDVLRVTNERFERELREQEFSKLATEAQLTALRSQINPHFLFNALTTIGYLIQASPEKAFQTLMQLTKLLRVVLSLAAEFHTLDEELRLIESYLEIERARLEERLRVRIMVPDKLKRINIPALIIQPLVENAIKHGIAENKKGGEVKIVAKIETSDDSRVLNLTVSDTGSGGKPKPASPSGVGLRNIRERLLSYYGTAAEFSIEIDPVKGTLSRVRLPLDAQLSEMRPELISTAVGVDISI